MAGDDRAEILRRRALLLTSALSALGCGPAAEAKGPDDESAVAVPTSTASADPPPETEDGDEGKLPSRTAQAATPSAWPIPPYDTPDWVNDEAKNRLKQLYEGAREAHGLLEQGENRLPAGCRTLGECQPAFAPVANTLLEVEEKLRFLVSPCRGSSKSAKEFGRRADEHMKVLRERLETLRTSARELAAELGDPGTAAWEKAMLDARMAKPQICLSYGCMDW